MSSLTSTFDTTWSTSTRATTAIDTDPTDRPVEIDVFDHRVQVDSMQQCLYIDAREERVQCFRPGNCEEVCGDLCPCSLLGLQPLIESREEAMQAGEQRRTHMHRAQAADLARDAACSAPATVSKSRRCRRNPNTVRAPGKTVIRSAALTPSVCSRPCAVAAARARCSALLRAARE